MHRHIHLLPALPPYLPSVLWHCWLGLLTCRTVCQITYTVLVEILNLTHSPSLPESTPSIHPFLNWWNWVQLPTINHTKSFAGTTLPKLHNTYWEIQLMMTMMTGKTRISLRHRHQLLTAMKWCRLKAELSVERTTVHVNQRLHRPCQLLQGHMKVVQCRTARRRRWPSSHHTGCTVQGTCCPITSTTLTAPPKVTPL